MLVGPIFTRELAITPRRTRFYIARSVYLLLLLVLMCTAWLVLSGTQYVRDLGDLARFGTSWFQIAATMQIVMALFIAALLTAGSIAQEKEKGTLDLLLMTHLSNSELVLGKWAASLLTLSVVLVTSIPFFAFLALLGGIDTAQIVRTYAVTFVSVVLGGAIGSTVAFWREKAFQALALTIMMLVLWFAVTELLAAGALGEEIFGISAIGLARGLSPWRAAVEAARPFPVLDPRLPLLHNAAYVYVVVGLIATAIVHGIAIALVRVWNPSQETRKTVRENEGALTFHTDHLDSVPEPRDAAPDPAATSPQETSASASSRRKHREVWDNPILWREMCTWAYGRKMLLLRLSYLLLFALAAGAVVWLTGGEEPASPATVAFVMTPLLLLSLVLVNAQAVTAVTSERDGRTLDLLLVSDISPREFVFGKLGGVFYNTKEMVLLPLALAVFLRYREVLSTGDFIYLTAGALVLYIFVAMLGLHLGLIYFNSRTAVAASLGTVFFLFVGVGVCMRMMLAFSGTFQAQMHPFLAFMIGGGAAMYWVLGRRNPSKAIAVASFLCPLATFYALTSLFLDQVHLVFTAIAFSYGFATLALLIPAIDEFDVATGRTTYEEG
ncbi:hypothetical protein JCM19992_07210 [Thermostilla marina]